MGYFGSGSHFSGLFGCKRQSGFHLLGGMGEYLLNLYLCTLHLGFSLGSLELFPNLNLSLLVPANLRRFSQQFIRVGCFINRLRGLKHNRKEWRVTWLSIFLVQRLPMWQLWQSTGLSQGLLGLHANLQRSRVLPPRE